MEYGININELEERLRVNIIENRLPYDADWIIGEIKKVIQEEINHPEKHMMTIRLKDGRLFYITIEMVHGNLLIRSAGINGGPSVYSGLDTRIS